MKNIFNIFLIILIVLFLSLYFSRYYNSYYENKNILTEDAIKKFEDDLKNGREISINNYIKEDKNYNNKVCLLGLKISNFIDKSFNKILKYILKHLDV